MTSLAQKLSEIVGDAFDAVDLPRELGAVRVSDRPDLAQFQCNGAMSAAKIAKKSPRDVAQKIVEYLEKHHCHSDQATRVEESKGSLDDARDDILRNIEIAGPGFINLNVTDEYLQNFILAQENFGVEPTNDQYSVVLDYGGMNVAKAMHVGHLRPTIIGDCLRNLYRFKGYKALGDIHLGDWGLQMGQIISEFEIRYPEWPYFDADYQGAYPDIAPFDYKELEEIYPQASAACKEDPARLELARKATADLQEGRAGYRALWQHFIELSLDDIKNNLAPLNIDFDIWKGEADVAPFIPEIGDDLMARGVAQESKGATVIYVAEDSDNKEMPPLLFYKSDGAVTYGTTDIATIYDRVKLYPDLGKIIYVVDHRQSLHFEQVFRSVAKAGYVDNIELHHVGFGTVNGPDGKPFKTREGKAMTFRDMVNTVVAKATDRLNEADLATDMDESARAEVARMVAVAALKFTELSNQPHMDYMFDIDKITAFEGKTGPYLLYQAVRIKSLLRKSDFDVSKDHSLNIQEGDRGLALMLSEFPDAIDSTLRNYAPHHLCDYIYRLAQAFSSFYGNCHILSEEDQSIRDSRLMLCQMTANYLEQGLALLGVKVPDRM